MASWKRSTKNWGNRWTFVFAFLKARQFTLASAPLQSRSRPSCMAPPSASVFRCQYVQLLEEAKDEKFDERRVNLLKAQLMQLERQV